ncbi:MAG: alpha/beta fold hydrolase [Candidatus Hodarchaeales archaeon]|jgi:pimeloyl-ACP methyl ester carboxylesterase
MAEIDKENKTIELKDGRNLGYAEGGDLNGIPMFHFHGHPGSRLEIRLFGQKPQQYGVHIITVDRPGHGLSDFVPGRTLLDWPDDIIELADHLGLDKFIVEGISGGGPYALACAYKIHERLKCCGILSGMGLRNWSKKGMMRSNRIISFIARSLPFLLKPLLKAQKKAFEDEETMKKLAERLPEPDMKVFEDPEVLSILVEEAKEAFRSGIEGVVAQEKIYTKPWGFDLGQISPKLQVYVWHGDMDVFVPSSFGHKFCEIIPNCKGFFYPEEGHLSLSINRLDEILKTLIS